MEQAIQSVQSFFKRKDVVISAHRYGIDAMGAMAQGLFCSLLIGTIINTLGRRMYVDPDKLPLIIVTNGSLNGIYATSGYNVGTGDMLLRLL